MKTALVKEVAENWFAVYFSPTGKQTDLHCETERLLRLKPALQLAGQLRAEETTLVWLNGSDVRVKFT